MQDTLFAAIKSPENAHDIIEAQQWPQNSETYFKLKTENVVFQLCKPLRKVKTSIFIATTIQTHYSVLFIAAMVGIQTLRV